MLTATINYVLFFPLPTRSRVDLLAPLGPVSSGRTYLDKLLECVAGAVHAPAADKAQLLTALREALTEISHSVTAARAAKPPAAAAAYATAAAAGGHHHHHHHAKMPSPMTSPRLGAVKQDPAGKEDGAAMAVDSKAADAGEKSLHGDAVAKVELDA